MSHFLSERYAPGTTEREAREAMQRLRSCCAELTETGVVVTFLGGTFVPSDEAFNCRFDGTAQGVTAAHAMAGVPLDRLLPVRDLQPSLAGAVKWTWCLVVATVLSLVTACTSAPPAPVVPTPQVGTASTPAAAPATRAAGSSRTAAATGSGSTTSATTDDEPEELPALTAPDFIPTTRTEELKLEIDRKGTSLQIAIDVFDLTIAPMPGASASALPPGDGFSATYALALVNRARRELSPAQLKVLDSVLAGNAPIARFDPAGRAAALPTSSPLPNPHTRAVPADFPPAMVQRYTRLMGRAINDWERYRSDLFAGISGYTLAFNRTQLVVDLGVAEMSTWPEADPRFCEVTVYPAMYSGVWSDDIIAFVFAHELFHCVQFSWNHSLAVPDWLVEGSAEFAARDLYRSTLVLPQDEQSPQWFTSTTSPLATRAYDTWPLFETFKVNYGTDPYPHIEKMIKTVNGDTAGLLANGNMDNPIFQTLWTSSSLRSTTFDEANWHFPWLNGDPASGPHDTAYVFPPRGIGRYPVKGKRTSCISNIWSRSRRESAWLR